MTVIIGFDVGTKTLANCIVTVRDDFVPTADGSPHESAAGVVPVIQSFRIADVSGGKHDRDLHVVERISRVIDHLVNVVDVEIERVISHNSAHVPLPFVIVENQMGPNTSARSVMAAIIAHYVCKYRVIVIGPGLKNKISLAPGLAYSNYIDTCKTQYAANKKHTKANFEFALRHHCQIENVRIEKSTFGHAADAYCQIVGFIRYGCNMDAF